MGLAQGHWLGILSAAGIPASSLVGRHGRPCPKCGGRDRFAPFKDFVERGAVLCRHCFHRGTYPRPGDGLATLQWWLRVDVAEAARWLSHWLGISSEQRGSAMFAPAHRLVNRSETCTPNPAWAALADVMSNSMRPHWLAKAVSLLQVSADALAKLRVGWSQEHRAMSFPMQNAAGEVTGIRLRCPQTTRKWTVPGSRAGLFYSDELIKLERHARVYVTEGPTDTAALLTIGLPAIGVPSAGGSSSLVASLLRRLSPTDIVIVADADEAGASGAHRLATALMSIATVRMITPPAGIKDARAWVSSGADRIAIETASNLTSVHRAAARGLFDECP